MFEAVITLALLVGIGCWAVRGVVKIRGGELPAGSAMVASTLPAAFPIGFVTVLGLSSFPTSATSALAPAAFAVGVLTALMRTSAWFAAACQYGMTVIGFIASVPLARDFLTGVDTCPDATAPHLRAAGAYLLLGLFALSLFATSFLARRIRPAFGVAVFGSLSTVSYLASPLGLSLVSNEPLAYVVAIIGACVLGAGTAMIPEAIAGVATVLAAFLWLTDSAGIGCSGSEGSGGNLTLVLTFLVGFAIMAVIVLRRSPRS